ncbi:MAG: tyrosine-type recombinase/integrase [Acidimicrobiales bacterium]
MGRAAIGALRQLSSGRWQARVTYHGHQVAIGTFATRREAARAVARAQSATAIGAFADPTAGRERLASFAESWWLTRSGHRYSTRVRDRLVLDHHVLPALGDRPLREIERHEVQAWVSGLSATLAPSTVQRTYTILAQLLGAAADAGLIAASPATRVHLPRVQPYEARFLNLDELEALADAIDPRYKAMVEVMAWATLRLGEAAGLRRVDLDLRGASLRVANSVVQVGHRIVEGPPKTSAGRRTMTLPSSAVADLAFHLACFAGSVYVFPGPSGERLHPEDWRARFWRPAVSRAGLSPLRPHDLKHTGVALLVAAGVDPLEIARRAGHTNVAFTLSRYGHLFPEVDKATAAKLDGLRSSPPGTAAAQS